jgi:CDP-4-dehydro-6-deoxyglucose reductase
MIRPVVAEAIHCPNVDAPDPRERASTLIHSEIAQIETRGPAVTILKLRVARGLNFAYTPGQYIDVLASDGRFRSFSLARAGVVDGCIELHIRRVANGLFTEHAMRAFKPGHRVSWRGPFGDLSWRGNTAASGSIFICTGTGFAPVSAILEEAFSQGWSKPISLYWGGRSHEDLYLREVAEAWARTHDNFRFIPVLSPESTDPGAMPPLLVHEAVMRDFPSLADVDVYACGSPAMVATAHETFFAQRGLREDSFMADPFGTVELPCLTQASSEPDVQIRANGIDYAVAANQTLLSALRGLGVAISSICGGRGACGTCMIEIDEASRALLPAPGRDERDLLECLPEVTARSRLACQIRLDAATSALSISIP